MQYVIEYCSERYVTNKKKQTDKQNNNNSEKKHRAQARWIN